MEKYLFTDEDATSLCGFLEPMLTVDFRNRVHARDMLDNPWLDTSNEEEVLDF